MHRPLSEWETRVQIFRRLRRRLHRPDKAERKFFEAVFAGLAQEMASEGDLPVPPRENATGCCSAEPEARQD